MYKDRTPYSYKCRKCGVNTLSLIIHSKTACPNCKLEITIYDDASDDHKDSYYD